MQDSFNLQRFVDAQNPVYEQVRAELRRASKQGHWMWFIFPQMKGLGSSSTAQEFGIGSRAEATAYLAHPLLGQRLLECTRLMNAAAGAVDTILGYPDNLKFRSSMTLFAQVAMDRTEFKAALEKFFSGQPDERTLELLSDA